MIQNRYLVVQPIGKGGMGEVYLAVDQRLGSAVALKRTYFSDDEALGSAFEREARILARLRHPVLPKVIDHFIENGDQYLVMEHISGDDLSKRLENAKKAFPFRWVMYWADQLLDALAYLHGHEPPIIHRDIKPQNLKLTDENHIVLLDFGLSKDFDTKTTGNPLNSASVAGYSPHFAAMEQIRGTGTDARSDLYSLSATLYQLMTNTVPADALTRADALLGGKTDPIKAPHELNPEIPAAVSEVILKAVSVRQDERFESAAEMQKALRRAYNQGKDAVAGQDAAALPEPAIKESRQTLRPDVPTIAKAAVPSMEETVEMSAPSHQTGGRQADIKTEVLQQEEIQAAAIAVGSGTPVTNAAAKNEGSKAAPTVNQKPAGSPKKKASLVPALLVGLVVLAAAGVGGGWWAYSNYFTSAKTAATPTPSPVTVSTPLAVPTIETADTNSQVPANVSSANDNSSIAGETPGRQTPGKTTPKTQPATAKPTPKAKKDDRTVILQ
jgi:serine/threonine protein kinase